VIPLGFKLYLFLFFLEKACPTTGGDVASPKDSFEELLTLIKSQKYS
jgi:hypothetical protein